MFCFENLSCRTVCLLSFLLWCRVNDLQEQNVHIFRGPLFADQLNTYDVVTAQYVVFSKEGFDAFLAAKAEPAAKEA